MPLRKAWIHPFSFQLWANSRTKNASVDLVANQFKAEKHCSLLLEKKQKNFCLVIHFNERNIVAQTYIAYGTKLRYNFHLGSGEVLNRNRRSRYVIVKWLLGGGQNLLAWFFSVLWRLVYIRRETGPYILALQIISPLNHVRVCKTFIYAGFWKEYWLHEKDILIYLINAYLKVTI